MSDDYTPPKVFISYAWEDDVRPWVRDLAKRLRRDGIDAVLDMWETDYGDQLPEFMERAVHESDFVILICTPKYKKKSDAREGGVGYEGHIITAEIFEKSNHRKFIPVLKKGSWKFASPAWSLGKRFTDLRGNPYSEANYRDLLRTLHSKKPTPPPVGTPPDLPDEDDEGLERGNPVAIFLRSIIELFSKYFIASKSIFFKSLPYLRSAIFIGIAIVLLLGSTYLLVRLPLMSTWFSPTLTPTATATSTPIFTTMPTNTSTPTSTPFPAGTGLISDIDGMKILFVPAGEFIMGAEDGEPDESPIHEIFLTSYWIDETEVTNAMYELCVDSGACTPPINQEFYGKSKYSDYPVVYVSWDDAKIYCEWAGRRLPTEAEWEKAARGTNGQIYPWGDESDCKKANYNSCFGSIRNVGIDVYSPSPYGAFDMAGNAWEWVADWYSDNYYKTSPYENPPGPSSGTNRSLRGGSFESISSTIRTAERSYGAPDAPKEKYGFRCATSSVESNYQGEIILPTATSTDIPTATFSPMPTQAPTQTPTPIILLDRDMPMILIPEGDSQVHIERGKVTRWVNEFYIDQHEVTHSQYEECVRTGACATPFSNASPQFANVVHYGDKAYDNFPVVLVSWNMAESYCRWRGKNTRLPTNAEWEKAARGSLTDQPYPWGDETPSCAKGIFNGANYKQCGSDDAFPIMQFGPNGYELFDMAGNVGEWVNGSGDFSNTEFLIRGGSWLSDSNQIKFETITPSLFSSRGYVDTGFRCARDATP